MQKANLRFEHLSLKCPHPPSQVPQPTSHSGVQPVYCLRQPLYLRALELLGQLQRLQLCDTSPFDAVTSTWQFNFDVNCLVVFFTWASQGKALVDLIVQSADLHFGEICYRLASHNLHWHCWRPSWLSCNSRRFLSIFANKQKKMISPQRPVSLGQAWIHACSMLKITFGSNS